MTDSIICNCIYKRTLKEVIRLKSDEWIIHKIKKRNEVGLQALIQKYAGLLKAVSQKHLYALPDRQDECLNDVLLSIWNHIDRYDPVKSSFKNWICAITRYRAINLLKKYRKDLHTLAWDETRHTDRVHMDMPFSKELWEIQLDELLCPLNKKDQQLFKDLFSSSQSTEEVARKHDLSQGALYSRVSRGKTKIRNYFSKEGNHFNE